MPFFRGLLDFISHVFDFFKDDLDNSVSKDRMILLKSDGTWFIINKKPNSHVAPPPNVPLPSRSWCDYDNVDSPGELLNPPDFFPKKDELYKKLEQGLELGVISSCAHIRTYNNIYTLKVEIPCTEDYGQSYQQFKSFVKAMETNYGFKTIQQDRVTSKTSDQKYHAVVFEYDPKGKFF